MNQSTHPKASLMDRLWHSRAAQAYLMVAALAALALPGEAAAQSKNTLGQGSWMSLGGNMAKQFCQFLESPIVTVAVGVGAAAAMIIASMNEDNGTLSKILKTVCFGMAILMLPGVLTGLGFGSIC